MVTLSPALLNGPPFLAATYRGASSAPGAAATLIVVVPAAAVPDAAPELSQAAASRTAMEASTAQAVRAGRASLRRRVARSPAGSSLIKLPHAPLGHQDMSVMTIRTIPDTGDLAGR